MSVFSFFLQNTYHYETLILFSERENLLHAFYLEHANMKQSNTNRKAQSNDTKWTITSSICAP